MGRFGEVVGDVSGGVSLDLLMEAASGMLRLLGAFSFLLSFQFLRVLSLSLFGVFSFLKAGFWLASSHGRRGLCVFGGILL